MGAYIATAIALLTLGITVLNIAREMWWPRTVPGPDTLAFALLACGAVLMILAVAVSISAFGGGPKRFGRLVYRLLGPMDLKVYPDMPLRALVERSCPNIIGAVGRSDRTLGEDEPEKAADILQEVRQHGRLGRLTIFGRKNVNEGFEEHTPLSQILATVLGGRFN